MSLVVFVGPSLGFDLVREILPGARLPGPAGCGDVYRAVCGGTKTLVLIDGFFDQRLAVWHKELLWALARGVSVYGGASMGALRAAELSAFGMVGVGRIFEAYRAGELEADDEVAIVHEAAERDYRPASEALVNLRATFAAARAAGALGPAAEAELIRLGRALFYPDRTLREILRRARDGGAMNEELARFSDWFGDGRARAVDQKRADALALLERVRSDLERQPSPAATPAFEFEYTEVWHEFVRHAAGQAPAERAAATANEPAKADTALAARCLALVSAQAPELASNLLGEAEERRTLLGRAERSGLEVNAESIQCASDEFRRRLDLLTPSATSEWLADRRLSIAEFSQLMREEALIARVRALGPELDGQLLQAMRFSREPLVQRALAMLCGSGNSTLPETDEHD